MHEKTDNPIPFHLKSNSKAYLELFEHILKLIFGFNPSYQSFNLVDNIAWFVALIKVWDTVLADWYLPFDRGRSLICWLFEWAGFEGFSGVAAGLSTWLDRIILLFLAMLILFSFTLIETVLSNIFHTAFLGTGLRYQISWIFKTYLLQFALGLVPWVVTELYESGVHQSCLAVSVLCAAFPEALWALLSYVY